MLGVNQMQYRRRLKIPLAGNWLAAFCNSTANKISKNRKEQEIFSIYFLN
jgi:hypothetical protein